MGGPLGSYLVQPVGRVESSLVDRDMAPKQGDEGAPDAWQHLMTSAVQYLRITLVVRVRF
jgi:hypothetical protein